METTGHQLEHQRGQENDEETPYVRLPRPYLEKVKRRRKCTSAPPHTSSPAELQSAPVEIYLSQLQPDPSSVPVMTLKAEAQEEHTPSKCTGPRNTMSNVVKGPAARSEEVLGHHSKNLFAGIVLAVGAKAAVALLRLGPRPSSRSAPAPASAARALNLSPAGAVPMVPVDKALSQEVAELQKTNNLQAKLLATKTNEHKQALSQLDKMGKEMAELQQLVGPRSLRDEGLADFENLFQVHKVVD
mmetsp:Transcript_48876/g.93455  ORF Transcript_48876/g.93455 Transcript_48876/m.93455 type:complete len:244 (-) Transcript_48876:1024-1755(-)